MVQEQVFKYISLHPFIEVMLLLFSLLLCSHWLGMVVANDEDRLLKSIKGHDIHVRPVRNISHPVNVTFGFNLIQIVDLNEREQIIIMKIWLRMTWYNEFMKWDPEKWGHVTHSRVEPDDVWKPDIFLQEDVGGDVSKATHEYKTPVVIHANGKHVWMVPVKIQTSCLVDVTNFPFDAQTCQLKFVSWTHDESEMVINIERKPIVNLSYLNSSQWILMDVERKTLHTLYPCCTTPYIDACFIFKLKRKSLYYMHNIIIPCIIQMIVILFTFFLPPDSGERIGLLITVSLVFAVYLQVLSQSLPTNSSSTPVLTHFFIYVMIESACSIIVTCFILRIHFKGAKNAKKPVPRWVKSMFIDCCGKVMGMHLIGDFSEEVEEYFEAEMDAFNNTAYEDIDDLCDSLSKDKELTTMSEINDILTELRVITNQIQDMNKTDMIGGQWQTLAKVLDRLCFFIFGFGFWLTAIVHLLPIHDHFT